MARSLLGLFICSCLALAGTSLQTIAQAADAADNDRRDEQKVRIARLIEQLGDENYHARVDARWELERIGLAAFGQLRKATNHPDIQIANVARYLVQSQNVIWWLETDAADVRRLLLDYNSLEVVERDTRLQELAKNGSDDALIALCRLARFESNERLSKSAALYLLEHLAEVSTAQSPSLPRSILLTIDDADRPATQWLRTLATELSSSQTSVEAWQEFTAAESTLAINSADAEAKARALRFYKWAGDWLTQRTDREQSLEIVRQSLGLVASNPHDYHEFATWAIDAGLPELTIELAGSHEQAFRAEPQLGYLLAESHQRVGHPKVAEELARTASDQIETSAKEKTKNIQTAMVNDIIAGRRVEIAIDGLSSRGLNEWAEFELKRAVELPISRNLEINSRKLFADFYWAGGKHREAAEVLAPLIDLLPAEDDLQLPGRFPSGSEVRAYYNFYLGLAAIDAGDRPQASQLLIKSVELEANPDAIIAMKIADEEPYRSDFETRFEKMAEDFRVLVAHNEQTLADSPDRMTRANVGYRLATACNQLAWLLSKCDRSHEEAINLSRRSLEFLPDEPAYLDTLGRCLFAAGNIDEAVEVQTKAVSSAPYDRMMRTQLAEFRSAQARSTESPKKP